MSATSLDERDLLSKGLKGTILSPPPGPSQQCIKSPPLRLRPRKRRRKRPFGAGGIRFSESSFCSGLLFRRSSGKREKPIPVTTEKAIRKTIVQTVSATGKIQPEVEVKISPEVAGEIIELPVVDGMPVKKGDLLIKIKPDSYKALVEAQEAAISGARAVNLQQKATLAKAEQDLKRAQDLFNKKMISESEFTRGANGAGRGEVDLRELSARNRAGRGGLEPGARSAFEDDDLLTNRWNRDGAEQQTRRTRRRDQSICRNRSHAGGRSRPHGSARGCE